MDWFLENSGLRHELNAVFKLLQIPILCKRRFYGQQYLPKLEAVVPNTQDLRNQTYLNLQTSRKSLNTNYKKSSNRSDQEQQDVSEQNVYKNMKWKFLP